MSQTNDIGRTGEFLASYILETQGIEVHHVDRIGADLWCRVGKNLFTMQVKSTVGPFSSSNRTSIRYYTFSAKNPNADYFCFVALDLRLLLVQNTASMESSTVRIAPEDFTEEMQMRSIRQLIYEQSGVE